MRLKDWRVEGSGREAAEGPTCREGVKGGGAWKVWKAWSVRRRGRRRKSDLQVDGVERVDVRIV